MGVNTKLIVSTQYNIPFSYLTYRIAGNFSGDFNLANWQFFFTKSLKLIPPNMRASGMRVIVRNGVVCGAHVFAKLKFANNIFRPIRQL